MALFWTSGDVVTSALGFKARVDPPLVRFIAVCDGFLGFTPHSDTCCKHGSRTTYPFTCSSSSGSEARAASAAIFRYRRKSVYSHRAKAEVKPKNI